MDQTIGFIGCGNMGKAMVEGIMKAHLVDGEQLIVANAHPEKLQELSNRYDFYISDNETVARHADLLILAVKPNLYAPILKEIRDLIQEHTIIIDIAAGIRMQDITAMMNRPCKIAKVMPNTAVMVNEGMSAVCFNDAIDASDRHAIMSLFTCLGKVKEVEEELMDAITAISGSSPAYMCMFIEALADGAVLLGMKREDAYLFAAQTMLGTAKLLLESGLHPAICKDQVCSPKGTTIEAVAKLEEKGFRSAIIEAMRTCAAKSKAMQE